MASMIIVIGDERVFNSLHDQLVAIETLNYFLLIYSISQEVICQNKLNRSPAFYKAG